MITDALSVRKISTALFSVLFILGFVRPAQATSPDKPVLLVPGTVGTALFEDTELVWPDLVRMLGAGDEFLTESLMLNANDGSTINTIELGDINREMLLEVGGIPVFRLDVWQGLIDGLEAEGYAEGASSTSRLFVFPYDWRLDMAASTTDLLNQKIEQIKSLTSATSVDIIAHSMGGPLVTNYLGEYGNDDINKLIYVGAPHLGAPKIAKILVQGDNLEVPFLNSDRIKELSENSASVYELLPKEEYFTTTGGGYIQRLEDQTPETRNR